MAKWEGALCANTDHAAAVYLENKGWKYFLICIFIEQFIIQNTKHCMILGDFNAHLSLYSEVRVFEMLHC